MGAPIIAFKLLSLFQFLPLEFYVFSPVLILSLSFLITAFIVDSSPIILYSLLTSSALLFLLYIYLLFWTTKYPATPGKFEHVSISNKQDYPLSPRQLLRHEIKCNNTNWFLDDKGRRILLRGVNLGGTSKLPLKPDGNTFKSDSLEEKSDISFIGRPFLIDTEDQIKETELHLSRLRSWGLTYIRLIVTWEAIEHKGPSIYDDEYIEYLIKLINKFKEFEISVYVDFHQDTWSRFTGGCGAPSWTLEKIGFDINKVFFSGTGFTQQETENNKMVYGRMHWNSNNSRLCAGTMWTIFFAGDILLPNTKIENVSAQQYYQMKYINMMKYLLSKLNVCDNILGVDVMNEPSCGFIGQNFTDTSENMFYIGHRLSPWKNILLGIGKTQKVDYFSSFLKYGGKRELNRNKECVWKNGAKSCVYYNNNVYSYDKNNIPVINKGYEQYFKFIPNSKQYIELWNDCSLPFYNKIIEELKSVDIDIPIYLEPILNMEKPLQREHPMINEESISNSGVVWAKHWYDGITLMTQNYKKYFAMAGTNNLVLTFFNSKIEKAHGQYLNTIKEEARLLKCPTIIGETGIPMNMFPSPYKDNNFNMCDMGMNTTLNALDYSMLSYSIWNYSSDNTNHYGDKWNKEDLSIFSIDQIKDTDNLHSGGRCLNTIVRPYAFRTAGDPVFMKFDAYDIHKPYLLIFKHDAQIQSNETIIFLPSYQYPEHSISVKVSDGTYSIDWKYQTLVFEHEKNRDDIAFRNYTGIHYISFHRLIEK